MTDWLGFVLLALAAHRTYRLIGQDTITQRVREHLLGLPDADYSAWADWIATARAAGEDPWQLNERHAGISKDVERIPVGPSRWYFAELVHCPWCLGWWVCLAWAVGWLADSSVTIRAALPFALSSVVAWLAIRLDP